MKDKVGELLRHDLSNLAYRPGPPRRGHPAYKRPRKEIDRDELRRLVEEGRSLRQIARELDVRFWTVHRAAKALGYAPGDPRLSELIQNPAA